jgi:hypothetical protein
MAEMLVQTSRFEKVVMVSSQRSIAEAESNNPILPVRMAKEHRSRSYRA